MQASSLCLLLATLLVSSYSCQLHAALVAKTLDFSLNVARLETGLHDGQQLINTTVKQMGISSFNSSDPTLQPGILVGYAWIDIAKQSPIAGMSPEGFYVGPALRSTLLSGRRLSLSVTAAYLYQRVRDSTPDQAVTLEWYQPQLDLDAAWHMTRRVKLLLGGRYGRVDADEKLSGNINQSINLKKSSKLGSRAGLELDLGSDGQAAIISHHAIGDGVELYFRRQF